MQYIIGLEVSNYAEAHFVGALLDTEGYKNKDYPAALKYALLHIDELLRSPVGQEELVEIAEKHSTNISKQTGEQIANNVGCTACVALVTKTEIFVANLGDSRCVLCENGKAVALSKDHKPKLEDERKRIEAAGGVVAYDRVNGVLNLSRSIGDFEYKNKELTPEKQIISAVPDIQTAEIGKNTEFLILACDGIWDCYTNEKAIEIFREKILDKNIPSIPKLSDVISEIMNGIIALDTKSPGNCLYMSECIGCDNMTCIVVQFLK